MNDIRIIGIRLPRDITPGDDLVGTILDAVASEGQSVTAGDIIVVTQKIVSKAEGQVVDLDEVTPSAFAVQAAALLGRDPTLVELVLREAVRVVRMDHRAIITETRHGVVCANSGVDESNVAGERRVTLLPLDADASARRLREGLCARTRLDLPVIVSDTFGRPWREGFTNVAIGVAGMEPLRDYRGQRDADGHLLKATILAVADEIASAAELVMGKLDGVPVAIVRGYGYTAGEGGATRMIRPPEHDMFR
jgi:coenzyme F420-0:L-glutamate ligase/coenzyme F420-1:gamma-L-glutamate ligase